MKHLEPFLSKERPVLIFQDNLRAHEHPALIEFCQKKGIHLFNFPPKLSHILQPLDKLFGPLKKHFQQKHQEAMLVQQRYISNSKIPIVTRFAMGAVAEQTIRSAFQKTRIFPLDRTVITNDLLVGQGGVSGVVPSHISGTVEEPHALHMSVWDENNNEIDPQRRNEENEHPTNKKEIQTDNVLSLPCSQCIAQEVSLHPAVSAGVVSLDLASVFIQNGYSPAQVKRRRGKRDLPNGRWLTSDAEMKRRREDEEAKEKKERKKKQRIEERQVKKSPAARSHAPAKGALSTKERGKQAQKRSQGRCQNW